MIRSGMLIVAIVAAACRVSVAEDADFTKAFRESPEAVHVTPAEKPAETPAEPRPWRALLWGPSWCGVCVSNADLLLTSPEPLPFVLEVRKGIREKGDEAAFPPEVRAFAEGVFPPGTDCAGQQRGWPVWQIELADGSWGFAYHARSAADIVVIHNLKAGQSIPRSTFTEVWKARNKPIVPVPAQRPRQRRTGPVAMRETSP